MPRITLSKYSDEVWQWLLSAGCTEAGAAGLMGNLYAESRINPTCVEELLLKRYREEGFKQWTDTFYDQINYDYYTQAVDSGDISEAEFIHPRQYTNQSHQYGYGLAQWTTSGRKQSLYDLCKDDGVSIGNLHAQLSYLYSEFISTWTGIWIILCSTESTDDASDIVLMKYECPANAESYKAIRREYAKQIYKHYTGDNEMSIIFGSARIDERGKASGGERGDQTGREVSTQPYYLHSGGWYVLRATSPKAANRMAENMIAACENAHFGYGQSDRDIGVSACKSVGWNCSKVTVNVNIDCSALVRVCVAYGTGIDVGDIYTGNERSVLLNTHLFEDVTSSVNFQNGSGLCVGDILVTRTKGHTGIIVSGATVRIESVTSRDTQTTQKVVYMFKCKQIYEGCPASNDVYLAQEILKSRGLYTGELDKQFGPLMAEAVYKYQKARGLSADKIIGPATWRDMVALAES